MRGNLKRVVEKTTSRWVPMLSHNLAMVVTLWHHIFSILVHMFGKCGEAAATARAGR